LLVVTGAHSTPFAMKGHTWHPQPVLLQSAISGSDKLDRFTETGANNGSLRIFPRKFLILLMQANAKIFDKFGAYLPAQGTIGKLLPVLTKISAGEFLWKPFLESASQDHSSNDCQGKKCRNCRLRYL